MVASTISQGLSVPAFSTIAAYHPQAALAIASGVPVRPSIRPLQVTFDSSAQLGEQQPQSFSQIISSYSIFAGVDITIDPSNAFPGNVLKYVNDQAQMQAETGITMRLVVRSRGADYTPVPEDTPLQSVGRLFSAAVGIWTMDQPDNVEAIFTLRSFPNAAPDTSAFPITIWFNFAFLVLGSEGNRFFCCSPSDARQQLKNTFGISC